MQRRGAYVGKWCNGEWSRDLGLYEAGVAGVGVGVVDLQDKWGCGMDDSTQWELGGVPRGS